jgi:hypothetical protein
MIPPLPWSKLDPAPPEGVAWHGEVRLIIRLAPGTRLPPIVQGIAPLGPELWTARGRFDDLDALQDDPSVLSFSLQQPLPGC